MDDPRDPVNELYDRGCDLVEAAAAIRRAASAPGTARAVPAILGCIEAALGELANASATIATTAAEAAPDAATRRRMHDGLSGLERSLHDGGHVAGAARALAAGALAGERSPRRRT